MHIRVDPLLARSWAEAPSGRLGSRSRRAAWAAFALLALLLVAYLVFLLARDSWHFSPWLDGWLVVGFEMIATGLCLARGWGRGRRRRVPLLLGAGCLSWTLGDLMLTLESLGGGSVPAPSLADAFYLGFFPLAFAAVVLFVRGEVKRGDALNWLDGAIAAIGMAALCSGLAFHGLERLFEGPSLAAVTSLAYPVGDVILLGLVAGCMVLVPDRSRPTLSLIGLGLAVNAAGDTFNFTGTTSTAGTVLNAIAWPTSILLFAVAMWIGTRGSNLFILRKLSGFVLPGLVSCSCLVILVAGSEYHFGPVATGLAAATLVLCGARLAFRPALARAREQLRSTEARYRVLFERNPEPVIAYDRETLQIVAVSHAMVNRYRYTQEEFLAMMVTDLVPAEERPLMLAFLKATDGASDGSSSPVVEPPAHHRLKDGTIIDVEVTREHVDLDERACTIAFFADVTERNRAAAEIAAARDHAVEVSNIKSAFLANVSHEIRTPMNGVIGMTELLLDMELTEEQRECGEQIARSGEDMLSLINDILDLSKIEAGHLELDITDFDLDETIKRTCSAAGAQARAKGLRLDLRIAPDVPRRVRGDGRRLGQIILNVVGNALKFTHEGGITVRIAATATRQHHNLIRIDVTDTGIGIEPAMLDQMFEPFTQADVSTTRHYGGTGLGLAIARELVELMGGTISATSQLGHGSTFSLQLELANAQDSAAAEATKTGPVPEWLWAEPPLVLIAEDSEINQIVATRAVERCGCRVHVVNDGDEALSALQEQRYDVILMDCQMPNTDGYQATVRIRRGEGPNVRTPIIAMTAHAMDGDRQRCLDAGMDDYITKPMRHPDLAAALRRWIAATPTPGPQEPAAYPHDPGARATQPT